MNVITIDKEKSVRIDHFDWQISPNGLNFRFTGLRINNKKNPIYVNNKNQVVNQFAKGRIEKHHWIYTFIYESGRTFEIEIDYNDKFISLTKK